MRTWTLWQNATDTRQDVMGLQVDTRESAPSLPADASITVIELEPVLDMIERLRRDLSLQESWQKGWKDGTIDRVDALLAEHGRSGDAADDDLDR